MLETTGLDENKVRVVRYHCPVNENILTDKLHEPHVYCSHHRQGTNKYIISEKNTIKLCSIIGTGFVGRISRRYQIRSWHSTC
jgi:hypothetical protein